MVDSTNSKGPAAPENSQAQRGSGKWITAFILVLIAAFFFGSVIINRIALTQA
ncbi:MAG: hypothetical protein AB8C46_25710 [Burkholderiaceae bacterium]